MSTQRLSMTAVLFFLSMVLLSACERPVPGGSATATAEAQQTADAVKPTPAVRRASPVPMVPSDDCHPLAMENTGMWYPVGNTGATYQWTCDGNLKLTNDMNPGEDFYAVPEFKVDLPAGVQTYIGGQGCSLDLGGKQVLVAGDATSTYELPQRKNIIVKCHRLPDTLVEQASW